VKRALLVLALAAGLAATAVPAAQAVPLCGADVTTNCWYGGHVCRVWIPRSTCIHTD
jgi:hypothetical protein